MIIYYGKCNRDEVGRFLNNMTNSLDKLIFDSNYHGKRMPEMALLAEVSQC